MAGLKRKLHNKLSPTAAALRTDWVVGEPLGCLWRPCADSQLYPYLPPHITRPRELRRLYVISLPERCYFAVSRVLSAAIAFPVCILWLSSACSCADSQLYPYCHCVSPGRMCCTTCVSVACPNAAVLHSVAPCWLLLSCGLPVSRLLSLVCLSHGVGVQVPRNMQLVAVPILDLWDNVARWGTVISALPLLLSRLKLSLAGAAPMLALTATQPAMPAKAAIAAGPVTAAVAASPVVPAAAAAPAAAVAGAPQEQQALLEEDEDEELHVALN